MNDKNIVLIKNLLNECNIVFEDFSQLDGMLILREALLHEKTYTKVQDKIRELKALFSSSYLTSLQKNAKEKQKWPLLNLVRQILKGIHYTLEPIRKSNGYTKDGKKIYTRYFKITKS